MDKIEELRTQLATMLDKTEDKDMISDITNMTNQLNAIEEENKSLDSKYRELLGNYKEVIKLCNTALKIKIHPKTYINEIFSWDMTIYDLLSISLFYENKLEESLKYLNIILENEPHNKRIIDNKKIIENMLKSTKKQQKKEL